MEVLRNSYVPGDPSLIDRIVCELKSQGIFDHFRKECIADVDTKPAYQNLRQRVEGSVAGFLRKQTWRPDMNKNQVREMLRKNIHESGFLETGVERIVDQVVNPKINTVFLPQVEDVVYRFLGIAKPQRSETKSLTAPLKINVMESLLPTDLEAISPDSDIHDDDFDAPVNEPEKPANVSSENTQDDLNDSKMDEDESPPFEPLEETVTLMAPEENSVDSHMSGFSGIASHDSNQSREQKVDVSNQDSQMSKHSSEEQMLLMMSDNETKMEVCEDSRYSKSSKSRDSSAKFEFNQDSQSNSDKSVANEKKADEKREHKSASGSKHKSSRSEKREDKDRDKEKRSESKDKKERHSSSKDVKSSSSSSSSKDKKDSKSSSSSSKHESRSEKEHDKDKSKSKSSTNRHSSSSRDKTSGSSKKESNSKEKSSDKDKSKTLSSKDSKPKDKGDSKSSSSHSSSRHSSDKHKKDDKSKHSSSSHHKDKRDSKKDSKKENKDDHFSSKHKKYDRRSKDRDSNDGQSSQKGASSVTLNSTTSSQTQKSSQESSGSNSGSADSGTSETDAAEKANQAADFQRIKIIKPKFASNIHEAKRLMKIRKQLDEIERKNQFSLDLATDSSLLLFRQPKSGGNGLVEAMNLESAEEIQEKSPAEEAAELKSIVDVRQTETNKLVETQEEASKDVMDVEEQTLESSVEQEQPKPNAEVKSSDVCLHFKETTTPEAQRFLEYAKDEMQRLERCIESTSSIDSSKSAAAPLSESPTKNDLKRKRNVDIKNNNKMGSSNQNTDAADINSECGLVKKTRRSSAMVTMLNDNFSLPLSPAESEKSVERKAEVEKVNRRQGLASKANQRYSSEDLYKPRLCFSSSRRRNRNAEAD